MAKEIVGIDNRNNNIIKKKIKTLFIALDIICARFFNHIGPDEYSTLHVWNLNYKEKKEIITRYERDKIVEKYNDYSTIYQIEDKISFLKLFEKYLGRDYLILKNSSYIEFYSFVQKNNKIIAKHADGSQGEGIKVYNINEKSNVEKIYNEINTNEYDLVEEFLGQHKKFDLINKNGLPVIRVISFINDKKQVEILSTSLDVGIDKSIVNMHIDGLKSIVDSRNGEVITNAADSSGKFYINHPLTGNKFRGFIIPQWLELLKLVNNAASVIPEVRYIGWDIAITQKGMVIIEANAINPGITSLQLEGYKSNNQLNKKYAEIRKAL